MRSGRRATRGRRALLRCHPFQPGTQVVELIVPEDAVVLQPTDVATAQLESVAKAWKAGIPIATGNDGGTPFNTSDNLAGELERLVALGFSPQQALTAALSDIEETLVKPVKTKDGRYNQHVYTTSILIEVGNNKNTLKEALAPMPYLAQAIVKTLRA